MRYADEVLNALVDKLKNSKAYDDSSGRLRGFDVSFYHWGDIDLGGFEILAHLRKAAGMYIKPYMMDADTLKRYESLAKLIDEAYAKKLGLLLSDEDYSDVYGAIDYMIGKRIRLEQENILWEDD